MLARAPPLACCLRWHCSATRRCARSMSARASPPPPPLYPPVHSKHHRSSATRLLCTPSHSAASPCSSPATPFRRSQQRNSSCYMPASTISLRHSAASMHKFPPLATSPCRDPQHHTLPDGSQTPPVSCTILHAVVHCPIHHPLCLPQHHSALPLQQSRRTCLATLVPATSRNSKPPWPPASAPLVPLVQCAQSTAGSCCALPPQVTGGAIARHHDDDPVRSVLSHHRLIPGGWGP